MSKQLNRCSFNVGGFIAKYTGMVEVISPEKYMISVNRNLSNIQRNQWLNNWNERMSDLRN